MEDSDYFHSATEQKMSRVFVQAATFCNSKTKKVAVIWLPSTFCVPNTKNVAKQK